MLRARSTPRAIGAVRACPVLLFPTLADAKRGASGGKPRSHAAHGKQGQGKQGTAHSKAHKVLTLRLKNSAVEGDPCSSDDTLTMSLDHSNRHRRGLVGSEVSLDLTGARLVVADVNGDGSRDLDDVAAGGT